MIFKRRSLSLSGDSVAEAAAAVANAAEGNIDEDGDVAFCGCCKREAGDALESVAGREEAGLNVFGEGVDCGSSQ